MARPKKDIDPAIVEKLAQRFCSRREVAAVLECDEKTIRNRFSAEYEKGQEEGRTLLRELQWKAAKAGNVAMLIWLGKQYLDQRDKTEDVTGHKLLYEDPRIRIGKQVSGNGRDGGNGEDTKLVDRGRGRSGGVPEGFDD